MNNAIEIAGQIFTHAQLLAAWRAGNDAGRGVMVGDDSDTVMQAVNREGLYLVHAWATDCSGDTLAVVAAANGDVAIVCELYGPWLVPFDAVKL